MGYIRTLLLRWCLPKKPPMNERIATLLFLLAREFSEVCKTPTSPMQCCPSPCATKEDLLHMEQRLLAAMVGGISDEDKAALDGSLARLTAMVEKFEQTDAKH